MISDVLAAGGSRPTSPPLAGYLTARVLVTGAGGSIGSSPVLPRIRQFHPAELIMLDRDESALHAVQLSPQGRALLDSSAELDPGRPADPEAIRGGSSAPRRPRVVFHAAALERFATARARCPAEALKTNVRGTQTVLDAAREVEKFVNISTDARPKPGQRVLGYQRITERLTTYASTGANGTFLTCGSATCWAAAVPC